MTSPAFCFLVSLALLVTAGVCRPQRASCPSGWYVQSRSDRCDGCYECRPVQPSRYDSRAHEADEPEDERYHVHVDGVVGCARPIVRSAREIVCQP